MPEGPRSADEEPDGPRNADEAPEGPCNADEEPDGPRNADEAPEEMGESGAACAGAEGAGVPCRRMGSPNGSAEEAGDMDDMDEVDIAGGAEVGPCRTGEMGSDVKPNDTRLEVVAGLPERGSTSGTSVLSVNQEPPVVASAGGCAGGRR